MRSIHAVNRAISGGLRALAQSAVAVSLLTLCGCEDFFGKSPLTSPPKMSYVGKWRSQRDMSPLTVDAAGYVTLFAGGVDCRSRKPLVPDATGRGFHVEIDLPDGRTVNFRGQLATDTRLLIEAPATTPTGYPIMVGYMREEAAKAAQPGRPLPEAPGVKLR